ncbi:glycoside hydrolase family 98 domain-containing protein [Lutibacter citreus]|uniref:glycoside hydrolase family 98 domain-containing protein n=1 Tax=Lutibacter citreus TaxID=2138210 RepID=UPI000DBE0BCA|nr:glycosyl hydrolase family 98 C-terminal domain-containing protein [Lutibacter citreus]
MKKIVFLLTFILSFYLNAQNGVELLFPDNNENLTDVAVAFKAKITKDGPYILQVSKQQDFSGRVLEHKPTGHKKQFKSKMDVVYFLTYQGKLHSNEKFLLDPGTWYWRVSGDNGTTFSATRNLIVNNKHTRKEPERLTSPNKPLFHMRLRCKVFDFNNPEEVLAKIVPEELKEYVVFDLRNTLSSIPGERSVYAFAKLFNDAGYKFYYDLGSQLRPDRIGLLGEYEKIARELPNCIGASITERFYDYQSDEASNSVFYGALAISKKYGKSFQLADINWRTARWPTFSYNFYDEFEKEGYGDYFHPVYKTTSPWGAHTCISTLQGMKLSGMTKNIGIWSDGWCWEKFGDVDTIALGDFLEKRHGTGGQKNFPYIQNLKWYIYGMTFGSTVFALEPSTWAHYNTCEPNELYSRYLLPFYKAVVKENIIPSVQSINDNFNIVVDPSLKSGKMHDGPWLTYMPGTIWNDYLTNTFGISKIPGYNDVVNTSSGEIIQAAYLEVIPNTDRYPSGVPFLAKPGIPAPVVNGRTLDVVKLSELRSKKNIDEKLNKYYPESDNEAYAVKIDKSIFVFNTTENHDIRQKYTVDINCSGIQSLSGNIDLMSYVMGKCRTDDKSVFFQVNGYVSIPSLQGGLYSLPSYPSVMKFKCLTKPDLTSNEMSAITKSWNKGKKELTVTVDHTNAGAVDFVLSTNK